MPSVQAAPLGKLSTPIDLDSARQLYLVHFTDRVSRLALTFAWRLEAVAGYQPCSILPAIFQASVPASQYVLSLRAQRKRISGSVVATIGRWVLYWIHSLDRDLWVQGLIQVKRTAGRPTSASDTSLCGLPTTLGWC